MADDDALIPFNGPRRPTGAEQWEEAIRTQQQRDLTKPSMGEQVGDIVNRLIAGNPLMQVGQLYQDISQGLDPLSPQAAGRGLWAAMSMAGAGMPYAQRGAIGATGGKPFWESMKGVRMSPMEATRRDVLDKLIAHGDFEPTMREGRTWYQSLSPAENEVMNRIGWSRAPDVTLEQETSPKTARAAWERNIRHWRELASAGQPAAAGLSPEHVRWAAKHDWFVGDNGDGTIMVRDQWYDRNTGETHDEVIPFTGTIDELRRWAGY